MARATQRAAAALLVALLAAACGAGDDGGEGLQTASSGPSNAASAPPLPSLTPTAASQATPSPSASTSPSPSPSASPAADPAGARASVIAAAELALGARHVPGLTRAACLADNPRRLLCIELVSDAPTLAAGLARFAAGDLDAGNFAFLMGRTADNRWQFLRGSQQEFYEQTKLPGPVRVCSEGAEAPVRGAPSASAPEVGRLKRLATVDADAFVLTRATSLQTPDIRGQGFYRVSGAVAGWVDSRDVAAAGLGSCDLHDSTEGTSHG